MPNMYFRGGTEFDVCAELMSPWLSDEAHGLCTTKTDPFASLVCEN